jgi:hypothetical protein
MVNRHDKFRNLSHFRKQEERVPHPPLLQLSWIQLLREDTVPPKQMSRQLTARGELKARYLSQLTARGELKARYLSQLTAWGELKAR